MRVLLISANTEQINMPVLPLGLGCIARAVQEAGHEVQVINLMSREDIIHVIEDSIQGFSPEVIGISVRNIDDQAMAGPRFLLEPVKDIVTLSRQQTDAPIVIGGAGYSIFPDSALEYLGADMGIQGEGERAFTLLLDSLHDKNALANIPGLYLPGKGLQGKRAFTKRLDDCPIPLPGAHLPRLQAQQVWVPFQTRRGCPMQCTYCSTALIEGEVIRRRDPACAVKMLGRYGEAGLDQFFFVDNTFNLPAHYAKALCDEIIAQKLNISWRCILYPWKIDEELIAKMAAAGCVEVSLGFESGSAEILRRFNKRFIPDDVRRISGILGSYRIRRTGFLLLGGPGETRDTVMESLDFADEVNLEFMKITLGIRIYPHTPLAYQSVREGIIDYDDTLLFPAFYMVKDLGPWIEETTAAWLKHHPDWNL